MSFTSNQGLDYANPPPGCAFTINTCDDAGPAIGALSDGHLGDFFDQQPWMGPVTLVVRAPAVAVTEAAGAGVLWQYRWGAFVCLLAAGLFGVWLATLAAKRGRPWWFQTAVAVGALLSPTAFATLKWGHPEEMVAAVLAAGALIVALRGRAGWAGVLLGLALASKAWSLLALPALLVVLPRQWKRALAAVVVTAGLLAAPMAAGSPHRFRANVSEVGKLGSQLGTLTATNVLWPLGDLEVVTISANGTGSQGMAARLPLGLARAARAFVFAVTVLLAFAWVKRGGRERPESALLLLALILMVRALADPGNRSYYEAAPFIALLSYETLARRVFPFASLAFVATFELADRLIAHQHSLDAINRLYLAWAIPFAIYMAVELLSGSHGARARSHRTEGLPAGQAGV